MKLGTEILRRTKSVSRNSGDAVQGNRAAKGDKLDKIGKQLVVAGVDVGSLCTKTVVMDSKGEVICYNIIRSGSAYNAAAETSMSLALEDAGLKLPDIAYIVSTGYGRARVDFAQAEITEITCHALGAKHFFPEVHTLIDIGGQDSKVIHVGDEGRASNFAMNDKCAAGTGRFLEVMAGALGVNLDELGELWFKSRKEIVISSMCTVFAESEVISLFAAGEDKADIAAALHRAIARRITGMVGQVGLRERVVVDGGVAKNKGVVRALEHNLRTTLLVPEEPQIVGAWGAAMIAAERALKEYR